MHGELWMKGRFTSPASVTSGREDFGKATAGAWERRMAEKASGRPADLYAAARTGLPSGDAAGPAEATRQTVTGKNLAVAAAPGLAALLVAVQLLRRVRG